MVYKQGLGGSLFHYSNPKGNVVIGNSAQSNGSPYVVQYSCDGRHDVSERRDHLEQPDGEEASRCSDSFSENGCQIQHFDHVMSRLKRGKVSQWWWSKRVGWISQGLMFRHWTGRSGRAKRFVLGLEDQRLEEKHEGSMEVQHQPLQL